MNARQKTAQKTARWTMGALVTGAAVTVGAGCGRATYGRTEVTAVTTPTNQVGGSISGQRITVQEGTLVVAHIAPINTDGNPMVAGATSRDSTIVDVEPTSGDRDFAFLGVHAGTVTVDLLADDAPVQTLEVDVTAQ